jgi:spermidine synthase
MASVKIPKYILLKFTAFICGAIVMITEIVGSRLIAPQVGTSIFVWTSLITVILASLSFGYWYGGKLADKLPHFSVLSKIILFASISLAILTFSSDLIFQWVNLIQMSLRWKALMVSIIIFTLPSILLGMVTPYCVRLYIQSLQNSGKTVGKLYSISTIGSITGTFLSGYVLIPVIGTMNILFICFLCLFILSLVLYPVIIKNIENLIIFLIIIFYFIWNTYKHKDFIEIESQYSTIHIIDTTEPISSRPIRYLYNNYELFSANYLDHNKEFLFDYHHYFLQISDFVPTLKNALMIGGAGCSMANTFFELNSAANMDIIEIDPIMEYISYEYFFLDSTQNLRYIASDGRVFLNKNKNEYDVIYMDAFQDYRIPFQLVTVEAFTLMKKQLNEDGILLINIVGSTHSKYTGSIHKTLKHVFPKCIIFAAEKDTSKLQNLIAFACKTRPVLNSDSLEKTIHSLFQKAYLMPANQYSIILQDNFAPVEYYLKQ